jgi:hypothetical protein
MGRKVVKAGANVQKRRDQRVESVDRRRPSGVEFRRSTVLRQTSHATRNAPMRRCFMKSLSRVIAGSLILAALGPAIPAAAATTTIRFNDLDLRDPHAFVNFLGCRDVTDTPVGGYSWNGALQSRIQGDSEPDGKLDLSYVLVFDDLNPAASGGTLRFGSADCTAPQSSTSCATGAATLVMLSHTQSGSSVCLGTLAGTTHGYTPAVTVASPPCFVTNAADLTIDLAGIPATLRQARIGGTLVGNPVTGVVNGLIRGFLTEADANNTILPATFPIVGGQPLSTLLPGGDRPPAGGSDRCCAAFSDKDLLDGTPGWWFHLNFTGSVVSWSEGAASVLPDLDWPEGVRVGPNPSRGPVTLSFALDSRAGVRVIVQDLQGRLVSELMSGVREAGEHRFS